MRARLWSRHKMPRGTASMMPRMPASGVVSGVHSWCVVRAGVLEVMSRAPRPDPAGRAWSVWVVRPGVRCSCPRMLMHVVNVMRRPRTADGTNARVMHHRVCGMVSAVCPTGTAGGMMRRTSVMTPRVWCHTSVVRPGRCHSRSSRVWHASRMSSGPSRVAASVLRGRVVHRTVRACAAEARVLAATSIVQMTGSPAARARASVVLASTRSRRWMMVPPNVVLRRMVSSGSHSSRNVVRRDSPRPAPRSVMLMRPPTRASANIMVRHSSRTRSSRNRSSPG
eukprot:g3389.t1